MRNVKNYWLVRVGTLVLFLILGEMLSIFHHFGHSNQGRKRSKMNPDRKRRSATLTVCR